MDIYLPEEIKHYEPELRILFDLMVRKLHVNRHKGFADQDSIPDLRQYIYSELRELNRALDGESQFDVALEAVDVANCSILLAMRILRLDKQTFEQERQQYRNGLPKDRQSQNEPELPRAPMTFTPKERKARDEDDPELIKEWEKEKAKAKARGVDR